MENLLFFSSSCLDRISPTPSTHASDFHPILVKAGPLKSHHGCRSANDSRGTVFLLSLYQVLFCAMKEVLLDHPVLAALGSTEGSRKHGTCPSLSGTQWCPASGDVWTGFVKPQWHLVGQESSAQLLTNLLAPSVLGKTCHLL